MEKRLQLWSPVWGMKLSFVTSKEMWEEKIAETD